MPFSTRGSVSYRVLSLMLIVLLLAPVIAIAQEKSVVDIRIIGNASISREAIIAAISPDLKVGSPYSEAAVAKALSAIKNMGYFGDPSASGFVTAGTESLDGGVRVIFTVVENPVVKEIKITGNTVIPTEKLRGVMHTTIGQVLDWNKLTQQDIPAIERYYGEQGYLANVTENVTIDENGVLNIPILETRVEEIKVTGNKKTKTEVILREMELKPGAVFNAKTLVADLTRVYDLDIFDRETTEWYHLDPGSELGKVIITIPVKEKKTGEVSVGVGYSSSQRLTGQAKLSQNNFRGRAETINLLWEQSDQGGSSYELGFYEPWVDHNHTSLGLNLYNKQIFRFGSSGIGSSTSNDYEERRKGESVTMSRPLGKINRGYLTFRDESVRTDVRNTANVDKNNPLFADGHVTSGTFRFTNDGRDSQLDPFHGIYGSYSAELGNASVNNAASVFTKYNADIRGYFSRGGARKEISERRKVLAFRAMAGTLTGNVPFFEQFFLGGAETLRGYKEDRFWGRYMLLASTEYRVPVAPSLTGVLFVDAGDAWGAPQDLRVISDPTGAFQGLTQHAGFSPSVGYGLGMRVITPIGPLRLDYGFGKEGSRLHFSMGHAF